MVRGQAADEYLAAIATLRKDVEDGRVAEADAEAIETLCAAFDPEDTNRSLPTGLYEKRRTKHVKRSTRAGWVERLRVIAHEVELTAEETTADDINAFTTSLKKAVDGDGRHENSTSHVRNLEHAASKFYRYHHDLGVDVDSITVHEHDDSATWDARDLLDAEERAALRTVADQARDLAIYHLGLYTGMRNTAIRTLRVKDIDLENHQWYFNKNADGLKDLHQPDEPRPLFQAERAVRDWKEYHPTREPDHYFITGKVRADPTTPVTRETIRYTMKRLKEKTAERDDVVTVKKPCHPHMLRHNFVSMARRHPDITDADIKFYLGHKPGSTVMETTYSHLSSDDHNSTGHSAFGIEAAGNGSEDLDPWDTTCPHCDRVLAPGEAECKACGTPRGETPWADQPHDSLTPERLDRLNQLLDSFDSMLEENPDATGGDIQFVVGQDGLEPSGAGVHVPDEDGGA